MRSGNADAMVFLVVGIAAVLFFALTYAIVVRGSLGLVKKRLSEEPELARDVPDEEVTGDELPTDIEY